ncbi:MAG TPA: Tim44-like domain-containing protein [Burkholderiales bacterium]|nr:Tim44-like domain-containing protein [Burkholderiales bacterium]
MRKLLFGFLAVLACTALVATDADAARRLGGGRSIGAQRSVTSAPPAAAPAKPAQQAAPASQPATQPAAQPQPASGFARWAPLLGGLALGGALGWLMGANGMGGLMVGLLLSGLLVFAAIALVRMLTQRRGDALPRIQYAGIGSETVAAPPPSQAIGFEAQPAHVSNANIPDGFDVAGFLKGAKLNYMRLQIANDQGNLDELREYTTDELFEELKRDVLARGGAKQQTDVLALNADLLEVVTEGDKHWASIRFSGSLREAPGEAPQGFEEVWNLAKPLSGGGWQLAGIQQMH